MNTPLPSKHRIRLSDSELAVAIAHIENLRLNPTGLSNREGSLLLALYELRDARAGETNDTTDADAARYRWLRSQKHVDIASCWILPTGEDGAKGHELDAAIDRARTAPETPSEVRYGSGRAIRECSAHIWSANVPPGDGRTCTKCGANDQV